MATEQRPLRLRFELRDDASPAPRVSQGGWVKLGAVATGERFWCRVMTVSADGILTASVDNDLLSSTIACPLRFGDVLVFHERNVLESASLAERDEFERLLVVTESHVKAAKLWRGVRQLEGTGAPPRHGTRYVVGRETT